MRVVAILKNRKNETIGVRVDNRGEYTDLTRKYLAENSREIKFDNAVVTKDGYVRAKSGKLEVIIKDVKNEKQNREHIEANKIINKSMIRLYHGTMEENLKPRYGIGKLNNDYGSGFYTTPNLELAREWAALKRKKAGFVHIYDMDIKGLNILDFTELDSMHWIAELLANRRIDFSIGDELAKVRNDIIVKYYKLNTSTYDVIIGYRADDKYFTYVQDFLNVGITKERLEEAMRLGDLGLQVFIKSKLAFDRLNAGYIGKEKVDDKYVKIAKRKDDKARNSYSNLGIRGMDRGSDKITVIDIIREIEKNEKKQI